MLFNTILSKTIEKTTEYINKTEVVSVSEVVSFVLLVGHRVAPIPLAMAWRLAACLK